MEGALLAHILICALHGRGAVCAPGALFV